MSRGEKKETVGSPTSIPAVALLPKFADSHSGRLFVYQTVNQSALGSPGAPVTLLWLGFTAPPLGEKLGCWRCRDDDACLLVALFFPPILLSALRRKTTCAARWGAAPHYGLCATCEPREPAAASRRLCSASATELGGASGLASIPRRLRDAAWDGMAGFFYYRRLHNNVSTGLR